MAGDDNDDTTPDPLSFKNVPRRPRTVPSGDPPGGSSAVSNNNNASPPPPAATSVASNKRPASSTAAGGAAGAEHVPRPNKKRRLVAIKEPEPKPKDANDRRVGRLGGAPPSLSHKDNIAAAAAAAASSASSSEAVDDWVENERCRKGKTPAVNDDEDDDARRPPSAGPGHGKLLGDAIRSHGSTAGSLKPPSRTTSSKPEKARTNPKKKQPAKKDRTRTKPKKKKEKKPMMNNDSGGGGGVWFWCVTGRDGMSAAGSDVDHSFDRIPVVSEQLRATLRGLGVAGGDAPVRLYGRLLTRCDRDIQQARLLMSCKKWRAVDKFPVCAFLTEDEKAAAHGAGLPITAYDRAGAAFAIVFRFLGCNFAYRLIAKWSDFLRRNGLDVGKDEPAPVGDDVLVDLWLFRLPGPEGKVGMVMLHYRRGDAPHADAVLDEVKQKRLQNNGDADAADAVMDDVVVDANEDAGVMGEVAAAAPAPSSPSEPSSGGGATEVAEADQAGVSSGKVPDAPSSSLSEPPDGGGTMSAEAAQAGAHGGAGRSDEVTAAPAPLLSLGGGDGTTEEEQEAGAGGALMVMVLEVGAAATQPSFGLNAGGEGNEVGEPPSSSPEAGGGASIAMMATTSEDEESADELVEAAARSWNVTKYEFQAAQGLMMLSEASSDSASPVDDSVSV